MGALEADLLHAAVGGAGVGGGTSSATLGDTGRPDTDDERRPAMRTSSRPGRHSSANGLGGGSPLPGGRMSASLVGPRGGALNAAPAPGGRMGPPPLEQPSRSSATSMQQLRRSSMGASAAPEDGSASESWQSPHFGGTAARRPPRAAACEHCGAIWSGGDGIRAESAACSTGGAGAAAHDASFGTWATALERGRRLAQMPAQQASGGELLPDGVETSGNAAPQPASPLRPVSTSTTHVRRRESHASHPPADPESPERRRRQQGEECISAGVLELRGRATTKSNRRSRSPSRSSSAGAGRGERVLPLSDEKADGEPAADETTGHEPTTAALPPQFGGGSDGNAAVHWGPSLLPPPSAPAANDDDDRRVGGFVRFDPEEHFAGAAGPVGGRGPFGGAAMSSTRVNPLVSPTRLIASAALPPEQTGGTPAPPSPIP